MRRQSDVLGAVNVALKTNGPLSLEVANGSEIFPVPQNFWQ